MKISPPAFPTYLAENMAHGMAMRDYFAAAALIAFANQGGKFQQIVEDAYCIADAMLAERNK